MLTVNQSFTPLSLAELKAWNHHNYHYNYVVLLFLEVLDIIIIIAAKQLQYCCNDIAQYIL